MQMKNDTELLEAYAESNNPATFAEIVSRYGSMVYRACFRTLINRQDAEDASQAVFMVLIKKAKRMRREGSLACWLHKVARQTALFAGRGQESAADREKLSQWNLWMPKAILW